MRVQVPPQDRARRALRASAALALPVVLGTLGYWLLEEPYSLLDSLYMTVITLATVGYQEVHPLSDAGRWFTIGLVVVGLFTLAFAGSVVAEFLVESSVRRALGRKDMQKDLEHLSDHTIVCGYGRVGRMVCDELERRKATLVVVERDPEQVEIPPGIRVVRGDATEDEVLEMARIDSAHGLVSAVSDEADAVLLTLTARQLNPDLFITARSDTEQLERKLYRAGANRVVCPFRVGATRMAVTTLQPNVFDFMSVLSGESVRPGSHDADYRVEEVRIQHGSGLLGRTLIELDLRRRFGVSVIGLRHPNGPAALTPPGSEVVEEGDVLVLIGAEQSLAQFAEAARPAER